MEHVVQYGDTLSELSRKYLGSSTRWPEIVRINRLGPADFLVVGQCLRLPESAKHHGAGHTSVIVTMTQEPACPAMPMEQRPATAIPARAFFFVVADEINPFNRKIVRKVAFPADLHGNPELLRRIVNPEKYGFSPRNPDSRVSIGRHVLGDTKSKFISASERPLGSPRFKGEQYWIDAAKVEKSGGIVHDARQIANDLDRIAAKTKQADFLHYIEDIRHKSLVLDKEVLIEGQVSATAVKGAKAMALTRGLQFVQGVGIVMSVHDLGKAGVQSHRLGSVRPLAAESIRQAGGWAAAFAGMKLGAATGALVGVQTGPGAVLTAAVGGLIGGVGGYFGFDWIADHIHEN